MNKETFHNLEEKVKSFKHTSFQYLAYEDIMTYEVVVDHSDMILIKGYQASLEMHEVIYACNDYDTFIALMKDQKHVLIKFIPESWYSRLKSLGYIDYAMMRDYWLNDLSDSHFSSLNISYGKLKDAKTISDITIENKGASRAFLGDDEDFIKSWIDGSNQTLESMKARSNHIYIYQENQHILGVALTCIYGDDSKKGPVLWFREIAVRKANHNQGIGRKLMMHALSEAYKNGAKRSFLMTDDLNIHAKHLYESIGFKADLNDAQIDMITPHK